MGLGLFLIRSGTANRGKSAESLFIVCVIRVKGIATEPSEGTRSRFGRDEEPTLEGDGVGSERRKARGGRLDGPGRLFGRPEASDWMARAV